MANLLRIIVELVEDASARADFCEDPERVLADIDDLTGEDVVAALKVAAIQVEPEAARHITDLSLPHDPEAGPRDTAIAAMVAMCEKIELGGLISFPQAAGEMPRYEDHVVPDHPPGRSRPAHLRAVAGAGEAGDSTPDSPRLAPVPDPPGGFEFGVLELVLLPDGIPDAGVEPGAVGTVVAVHRDPSLGYEVEVSGEDGGRQFLGVLPPSAVARAHD